MDDESDKTQGQNGAGNGAAPEADTADAAGEAGGEDRLAKLEAENTALRDRMLRAAAEADNVRKRAERESAQAREYAIERFAQDLLGVADNLSRALAALPADSAASASEPMRNLLAGVELTERELMRVFERHNIQAINPKGQPFDPNMHQAVAQIPSEAAKGHVAEVMQTGYRLGDRVLRAAMVAVSTGPAGGQPEAAKDAAPDGEPRPRTDFKV